MPKRIDTQAVLERMQSIYGCDCIPGRTPGLLHQFRELCAALGQEIADRDALWERCRIVYYPPAPAYPLEHNPHARKDMRAAIETALRGEEER